MSTQIAPFATYHGIDKIFQFYQVDQKGPSEPYVDIFKRSTGELVTRVNYSPLKERASGLSSNCRLFPSFLTLLGCVREDVFTTSRLRCSSTSTI